MKCGKCGNELRESASFCPGCGQPVNPHCATCGAEIRPGTRFCGKCGASQAAGSVAPATPSQHAPTKTRPTSPHVTKTSLGIGKLFAVGFITLVVVVAVGTFALSNLFGDSESDGGTASGNGNPLAPLSSLNPVTALDKIKQLPIPGQDDHKPSLGKAQAKEPELSRVIETEEFGLAPVDQLLVLMKDGQTREDAETVASDLGGSIVGEVEFINLYQIETKGKSEAELKAALDRARTLPGVEMASQNAGLFQKEIKGTRCSPLNDPYYKRGENGRPYEMIGMEAAWGFIKASGVELNNVHVGIMDEALYTGSEEVKGLVEIEGDTTDVPEKDDEGKVVDGGFNHGTMVTHVIGANPDNGGAAGVASILGDKLKISVNNMYTPGPGIELTVPDPKDPTKATTPSGNTYLIRTLVQMQKQIEGGARVINCSFGPTNPEAKNRWISGVYRKFLEAMAEKHPEVIFVAAAGNENGALNGSNYSIGGHKLPNLITVGALANDGKRASFSNHATGDGEVTLAAPGVKIAMGPDSEGKSVNASGTSFSTPMVAAAAALLKSINPKLTAAQVKQLLVESGGSETAVGDKKVPVPAEVGGKVLRVDNAVLKAINDLRKEKGLPPLARDFLEKAGVIDALADKKEPNEYTIKAVVGAVGEKGTDVEIELQGEGMLSGSTTKRLDKAGELTWGLSLVDEQKPPSVKVTRLDNNACSIIALACPEIGGEWTGTLTFQELTVKNDIKIPDPFDSEAPPQVITKEECEQGFKSLKDKPLKLKMTFQPKSQEEGTVTMVVTGMEGQDGEDQEPQELPYHISCDWLTIEHRQGSQTLRMQGLIEPVGDDFKLMGSFEIIDQPQGANSFAMDASGVWEISKPQKAANSSDGSSWPCSQCLVSR